MFRLEIQTDEVARILKDITKSLCNGTTRDKIYDINGNSVGTWTLT